MVEKWNREMRERSKPKEPGRRKSQKPGKVCKKEESQPKSESKLQRWQKSGKV